MAQYSIKGRLVGPERDMAQELKKFLKQLSDPTATPYAKLKLETMQQFRQALWLVQERIVATAPLVACTTVTAGSKIVHQNVGRESKGLAIIIDEATRDREVDTYIPLTAPSTKVVAIHLFGDTKSRMHPIISSFPNKTFYGKQLSSDSSVFPLLQLKLAVALKRILHLSPDAPDDKARLHYVEIQSSKLRKSSQSYSRANLEYVEWVMRAINDLHHVLMSSMSRNVMILTPYKRQAAEYSMAFIEAYRRWYPSAKDINMDMVPRVFTVSSVQENQSRIVFLDLVNISAENKRDFGFLADEHRTCVALTRAQEVFIIVGGPFEGRKASSSFTLLEYKSLLSSDGRLLSLKAPPLSRPVPKDLLGDTDKPI
ncbi:uncharacterized protein K452DRAFT_302583 [Aplosporella prunicola CBS 121167]|uniref:DNA2/NAM7 helicase-like C-terminal domain-containing protein n=1 Tax=Aplosporella prunicola CBS 121167 TaxID=1176127 RepID=A0A6A6AZE7_9PEZI|nr:uncharacterized protein K452DRAFT_302583 [Aplosporella prunicola CBS 121167]KAF2136638.1 hypothetical protein K452DRAFT_302583 [Aplosporella prunicola CBS 121167]